MNLWDDVCIHVITDFISDQNRDYLSDLCDERIEIIIVEDDTLLKKVPVSVWSKYTWYRIFIPKLLPDVEKVLYLDCDVIVNENLDDLFTMDMSEYDVAGCIDLNSYSLNTFKRLNYNAELKYICAGVLLMNLTRWRLEDVANNIVRYAINNISNIEFPDQDAINYVCRDTKLILPARFGVLVPFFFHEAFMKEHLGEMDILMNRPAIIHYAGYAPWSYAKDKSLHSHLWWKAYRKLNAFNSVKWEYLQSFFKTKARLFLSALNIIKPDSKYYYFNQYYNHPRITKKSVKKRLKKLKQSAK